MATKVELVVALAALGQEVQADDHTHAELTAMLSEAEAATDDAAERVALAARLEVLGFEDNASLSIDELRGLLADVERKKGFIVCEGKTITTRSRGILSGGDDIFANDLGGGQDALDSLYEKGLIE